MLIQSSQNAKRLPCFSLSILASEQAGPHLTKTGFCARFSLEILGHKRGSNAVRNMCSRRMLRLSICCWKEIETCKKCGRAQVHDSGCNRIGCKLKPGAAISLSQVNAEAAVLQNATRSNAHIKSLKRRLRKIASPAPHRSVMTPLKRSAWDIGSVVITT